MLFNSVEFLFIFLPITFAVYYFLLRLGREKFVLVWLILASLFFYGWWNPAYVLLLLSSILFNYYVGRSLISAELGASAKKVLLLLGLTFNLGLLSYFKYTNFLLESFSVVLNEEFSSIRIILPLAISFFTFQQVAFLVDAYRGKIEKIEFLRYCFFVSFFPQLIAGPIVHHSEIFPQLRHSDTFRLDTKDISIGLSQFTIGLFKKVIIADSLANFVDPVFASSATGAGFTSLDYTAVVIAFSLQIYFDFSAYSDMALGLGRLFSIRLPDNFNSPYKATNIIDFWRRWHMTLSRFLKDYLYIPLGGNKKGALRRHINLFITMLLGGLWHGAQWHFVFWGFLHGAYLSINHVWLRYKPDKKAHSGIFRRTVAVLGGYVSHGLTLFVIAMAWVFFRAESIGQAWYVLKNIIIPDGLGFSPAFRFVMAGSMLNRFFADWLDNWIVFYLAILLGWVLLLPNCQQLFRSSKAPSKLHWNPSNRWAAVIAVSLIISVLELGQINEFIYFQF